MHRNVGYYHIDRDTTVIKAGDTRPACKGPVLAVQKEPLLISGGHVEMEQDVHHSDPFEIETDDEIELMRQV